MFVGKALKMPISANKLISCRYIYNLLPRHSRIVWVYWLNMKSKNERKARRKKNDINENLLLVAKAEIIEHGFENTTLTNIIKGANIQANVFYNRYEDLHALFDKLIRPYDYWFEDNIKFSGNDISEKLCYAISTLIDSLNEDLFMQKLLIWEVGSNNYLTQRMSYKRELFFSHLIERHSKGSNVDISDLKRACALIVGGICHYFICRGKKTSINNGFNIDKDKEIEALKKQSQLFIYSVLT